MLPFLKQITAVNISATASRLDETEMPTTCFQTPKTLPTMKVLGITIILTNCIRSN